MNLGQIIDMARGRLDDAGKKGSSDTKKGWKNPDLAGFADDAESEIARQLFLLEDHDTIGYIKLTAAVGQVDSVSVSGVVITSAAVVYATSLANTAALLAENINAYTSTPNYRSVARGPLVVVKAIPNTGYPVTGYSLTATVSAGMAVAAVDTPGLCRHIMPISGRFVGLNSRVWRVTRFKPASQARPVALATRLEMDANVPDWEKAVDGAIQCVIPDYEAQEAIVYPPSKTVELIEQSCFRLPLVALTDDDMMALPEIGEKYHIAMVDWIIRQACLKPDIETWFKELGKQAETDFFSRIENWRIQLKDRRPSGDVNRIPGGFL
jgi:hypothetical protein